MDCDRVFSALTRGPFPSGDPQDVLVQQHLDRCLECWRIAEALRPADQLFHESIPPSETRDLPGYWGDAAPPATVISRLAQQAAADAAGRHPPYGPARAARTALAPKRQPATQHRSVEVVYNRTAQRSDMLCVGGILIGTLTMPVLAWWLLS